MPTSSSTAPPLLLVTILLGCLLGLVLIPAPLLVGLPLVDAGSVAVASAAAVEEPEVITLDNAAVVGGGGKVTISAEPMDDVERELRVLASLPDAAAAVEAANPPLPGGTGTDQQQQQQQPSDATGSSGNTNDDDEKKKGPKRAPRIHPRPPPCLDTNPSCNLWASVGECTHAQQYMHANCRESCHLCNPLNFNQDASGNQHIYQDYPGVAPRVEFRHPITFRRDVDDNAVDGDGKPTPVTLEYRWDAKICTARVFDALSASERYLARVRAKYEKEMKKYWADPKNYKAASVVVPELCRNNDELCPVWASWGMCEERPRAMKSICPLSCQICPTYLPGLAQAAPNQKVYKSFFERMDFEGMYAATWQRRTMMPPSFDADEGRDGDYGSHHVWDQSPKARAVRKHYGVDEIEIKQWQTTETREAREEWVYMYEDHPNDSDFSRNVVDFWNFLSSQEVDEALKFLKERGVPADAVGADGRGFGPKTKTVSKLLVDPVSGSAMVHRQSARTFVHDMSSHDLKNGTGNVLAPILHMIVSKLELLTGIPGKLYLEPQIKFEKFGHGDFQHPKLHYGDSVNATDPRMRGALVSFDYTVGRMSLLANYGLPNNLDGGTHGIPPRTMNNPRVFGLTICLNDAPEDSWFNIVISGNLIKCRKGLAVLYPVVNTLLGTKHDRYKHAGTDAEILHILDRNSGVEGDGTFIAENVNSVLEHPQYDGEGEVLMMQLYFRRFPNTKRWKEMPGMDVYTLDGRRYGRVGGRPLDSHKDVLNYVEKLINRKQTKAADDEKHLSIMETMRTRSKKDLKILQAKLEKAIGDEG